MGENYEYGEFRNLIFNYLQIPHKNEYGQKNDISNFDSETAAFLIKKKYNEGKNLIYVLNELNSFYKQKLKKQKDSYEKDIEKYHKDYNQLEEKLNKIHKLSSKSQ